MAFTSSGGSTAPLRPSLAPVWVFTFPPQQARRTIARSVTPLEPLPDRPLSDRSARTNSTAGPTDEFIEGELLVTIRHPHEVGDVLGSVTRELPSYLPTISQDF
jgi:hypothetical protein